MRLGKLARLLRSKNAGPFILTIDVLFPDRAAFDTAVRSSVLEPERIAHLYGVDVGQIRYFELPDVLAVKISFPRPEPSGSVGDSDVYGCQYMARLASIEVPA